MIEAKIECKQCPKERFASVVDAIEKLAKDTKKKNIIVAIDGRCASGKTTLGFYLMELFDANLFHLDDFFLQGYQRTEERLAEVGGNMDYERFLKEVIQPVQKGEAVHYRAFDCKSMSIKKEVLIPAKRMNIIEGSYCRSPHFGEIYDLKVFLDISPKEQLEQILHRNGAEQLKVFQNRWIPKEDAYFEKYCIKETSDIVVEWRKTDDLYSDI